MCEVAENEPCVVVVVVGEGRGRGECLVCFGGCVGLVRNAVRAWECVVRRGMSGEWCGMGDGVGCNVWCGWVGCAVPGWIMSLVNP